MKISRKAQNPSYAVPIILLATAVLFLFYLIMLYPWERAALLGYNYTTGNESPLGPGTEILYSSGEITEVGAGTGGVISSFAMNNFSLSYPAVPVIVDSSTVSGISANVLTSDTIVLNANNVNPSYIKGILLKINVTAVEGNPKIVVILNDTTVYTGAASVGMLDINIPSASLRTNNPIYVKLYHTGMFWEVQKIKLNSVVLYRVEYQSNNPSQSQIVPISSSNYQGNTLKIKFITTLANTDGSLLLNINGKQVWSGKPASGSASEASVNLEQSNIKIGDNTIEFAVERGGEYTLTNVSLQFVAEATPAAKKVYSFDINSSDLYSGRPVKVGIEIERVIQPGTLQAKIIPYDTSYYFSKAQMNPGVWVYTNLDKTKLKELGNQIELNSIDGRFKINGFMIVLG